MANDAEDTQQKDAPILQLKPTQGLTDYFCPFCNQKLFRGDVRKFSMVCDYCNRLVTDTNISQTPDQQEKP